MPSDQILRAFNPWMLKVAACIGEEQFEEALHILTEAERELKGLETDGWLHHTCVATKALIHQQQGDFQTAINLYLEAQSLQPNASEYMVNQLGIAQSLRDSGQSFDSVAESLEAGLRVADSSLPTALPLLRAYADLALSHDLAMPLGWSALYLKACESLSLSPVSFDPKDPQSFTRAVGEHQEPPESRYCRSS